MKKVFVGGNVMCGKNILRKLLDGHPNIISNHIGHSFITSLLVKQVKDHVSRPQTQNGITYDAELATLNIRYRSGEKGRIDFPDLLWILYKFGSYRFFHRACLASKSYFKSKEGAMETVPFNFDIHKFESSLEQFFISQKQEMSVSDFIDVIYSLYADHWLDNGNRRCPANENTLFIDTLQNGINPVIEVLQEFPDARLLVMDRSTPSLVFANSVRMAQQVGWNWERDSVFSNILYGQWDKVNSINMFRATLARLARENDNLFIVDFERMILNTRDTMEEIADFLEIRFDNMLVNPSIAGITLEGSKHRIIGKINDDPDLLLKNRDKLVLKIMCYEPHSSLKSLYGLLLKLLLPVLRVSVRLFSNSTR